MSSPIAIPSTNTQRAQSPNGAARSLPGNASGLYVPVHRRGASTSSTSSSSFSEHGSLSPVARATGPRTRSVSPMPHNSRSQSRFGKRHLGTFSASDTTNHEPETDKGRAVADASPMPSPRSANIPLTPKIPNTYTITELLALSSSPAHFTPAQRAQIDAHIPFMTRKRSSKPSPSPSSASTSSRRVHLILMHDSLND